MTLEMFDVVIVGAGLSGIGAAWRLQMRRPGCRFTILESRDAIGGTWDLFRYPGIRSDSAMFTLGYPFRPWTGTAAFTDGASIRSYIDETAHAGGLDRKIRFGHKVRSAAWSSQSATWTLDVVHEGRAIAIACRFVLFCAGYYDYAAGHRPALPGADDFRGEIVHPQDWPQGLDTGDKAVVVVGSGATAMTLAPALAQGGARVTLLQRSPSDVVALTSDDCWARRLRRVLPARLASAALRWRDILIGALLYSYARRRPAGMRRRLLARARARLGPAVDADVHFAPRYAPWDQRMCVLPDGDLFDALKSGRAAIVTDEIDRLTASGVALRSGRTLEADVLILATGLNLRLIGGATLTVDGAPVDLSETMSYKGAMFSGVPNLVYALGYINASWTLKSDLVSLWVCRLLAHMQRHALVSCVANRDPSVQPRPLIGFTSGYVGRAAHLLPNQGDRAPWRVHQTYLRDLWALRFAPVDDGVLAFAAAGEPRATAQP